jgi:hypothetical protein
MSPTDPTADSWALPAVLPSWPDSMPEYELLSTPIVCGEPHIRWARVFILARAAYSRPNFNADYSQPQRQRGDSALTTLNRERAETHKEEPVK